MDKRIKNAVKYIDENLERKIILKEIAKISNLSYSRFAELFKKELNMNFSAYLKMTRIAHAKELLKNDSLSIKEISYKTGYKHISNFNHDFKNITGISPSKYKRKYYP
ncbi:MAG: helix-turn-helix domain-containing protein [Candidatus Hodarchaeota archaeon]